MGRPYRAGTPLGDYYRPSVVCLTHTESESCQGGGQETLKLASGKRRLLRRYNPVNNNWDFTTLGKRHYKKLKRKYVVHVPVDIHGAPNSWHHLHNQGGASHRQIQHI